MEKENETETFTKPSVFAIVSMIALEKIKSLINKGAISISEEAQVEIGKLIHTLQLGIVGHIQEDVIKGWLKEYKKMQKERDKNSKT